MSTVVKWVDVEVDVRAAYNQWTQFEEFPTFMDGVERVRQIDETSLEWAAEIAGVKRTWRAKITEQVPDQRIAWRAIDEPKHAGVVTFHRLDDNRARVTLQMDVEPGDVVEKVGDALGFLDRQVEGDLKRFKEFIESRGHETGAWRGKVEQTPSR